MIGLPLCPHGASRRGRRRPELPLRYPVPEDHVELRWRERDLPACRADEAWDTIHLRAAKREGVPRLGHPAPAGGAGLRRPRSPSARSRARSSRRRTFAAGRRPRGRRRAPSSSPPARVSSWCWRPRSGSTASAVSTPPCATLPTPALGSPRGEIPLLRRFATLHGPLSVPCAVSIASLTCSRDGLGRTAKLHAKTHAPHLGERRIARKAPCDCMQSCMHPIYWTSGYNPRSRS